MVLNPGTPDERDLGNRDTAVLQPGEVLQIRSAGGGGRGDPFTRAPERVALDVARGYVSAASALHEYGVVIKDGAVDNAATDALRSKAKPRSGMFHFGAERDAYETQWTDEAYDRLSEILLALPIHWRFFTKTEIFARMQNRQGAEGVDAALAEVCGRFPDLDALVPERPKQLERT
jgi:N-methylhydantoinase B